jgi:hypothetical protein
VAHTWYVLIAVLLLWVDRQRRFSRSPRDLTVDVWR